MIILSVHSTTPHLGVALTDGDAILAESILPADRKHLENLPRLVSEALEIAGMGLEDVNAFAAALGPGSFSGVRIGLAAVKGFRLALKKPMVGVSSLEILAAQAAPDAQSIFPVIDAGRGQVYAAFIESVYWNPLTSVEPVALPIGDFPDYFRRLAHPSAVVCGDSIIERLGLESGQSDLRLVDIPKPSVCGFLARRRLANSDVDDVFLLTPTYIRKSDAEEKKSLAVKS